MTLGKKATNVRPKGVVRPPPPPAPPPLRKRRATNQTERECPFCHVVTQRKSGVEA